MNIFFARETLFLAADLPIMSKLLRHGGKKYDINNFTTINNNNNNKNNRNATEYHRAHRGSRRSRRYRHHHYNDDDNDNDGKKVASVAAEIEATTTTTTIKPTATKAKNIILGPQVIAWKHDNIKFAILEDLMRMYNFHAIQKSQFDIEHANVFLKYLANFHATSHIIEAGHTLPTANPIQNLYIMMANYSHHHNNIINHDLHELDSIYVPEKYDSLSKKFLNWNAEKISYNSSAFNVILHNDLEFESIIFQYDESFVEPRRATKVFVDYYNYTLAILQIDKRFPSGFAGRTKLQIYIKVELLR